MLVSEMRAILSEALSAIGADRAKERKIRAFLAALSTHDSISVEALAKMFQLIPLAKRTPKARETAPYSSGAELRTAFHDDMAFERVLDRIVADKKATKAALLGIYEMLFDTLEGVPAKSSRGELVDLIRRERTRMVRNRKANDYLSQKTRA